MKKLSGTLCFGCLISPGLAMVAMFGTNISNLRGNCAHSTHGTSYGDNRCRCVGIDNLQGYYATQVDFHHVQYAAEAGASCQAWDRNSHPACKDSAPPQWCSQQWCYVDPCSCDLDILPKASEAGIKYQGGPAYFSYDTCGDLDFFSQEIEGACVNQKTAADCAKQSSCAWTGKECAGKEIAQSCKNVAQKDKTVYGEDDCRCVGLSGKDIGKAFMYINEKDLLKYPADVGATCQAWEEDVHPDCLKDGEKPSWCSQKWCFVDPCKCKTKMPPKTVMPANRHMRFQGKTAYWSYATCGSTDSWSSSMKGSYCVHQATETACAQLENCAWNGKECMGKALVEICDKQESSGILGIEDPLPESSTVSARPMKALLAFFCAIYLVR